MTVRTAINGFGRVGRCFLRSAHEREAGIEVAAINAVTDPDTLAALLRHDSVYGRFPGDR
jgi:glyceraldehyde 3-phosphate dehydrogenase